MTRWKRAIASLAIGSVLGVISYIMVATMPSVSDGISPLANWHVAASATFGFGAIGLYITAGIDLLYEGYDLFDD